MAAYPEVIEPLREEIEELITEHGWSKDGLDSMVKLDSFLKETQRLSPLGSGALKSQLHFSRKRSIFDYISQSL